MRRARKTQEKTEGLGDSVLTRRKSTRPRQLYTPGELNRLCDAVLHPLAKYNPSMIVLDSFIHGVIERNTRESVMKFVQYNLPKVVEAYQKSSRRARHDQVSKAKRSS